MHSEPPDLTKLEYDSQRFAALAETPLGRDIWDFMKRADNLIRIETAMFLGRAAVEPLAPGLIERFGADITQDRTKQMVGHMAHQIVAAHGFQLDRLGRHIVRGRPRTLPVPAVPTRFDLWLDHQIKEPSGSVNLEKLYAVARHYGVAKQYPDLTAGQQRFAIAALLRLRVPAEAYAPAL